MRRFELEKLYELSGLEDYKIKTTEDLLKVHNIDYKAVDGYNRLDDLNKRIYEKFIVNIFNGFGLESRATLIPKGIYYVEDTDYLYKEDPEQDYYTVIGGIVKIIDKNGLKSILRTWTDEDYKDIEPVESDSKNYLRFEYKHNGRKEWLHVIKEGNEWY